VETRWYALAVAVRSEPRALDAVRPLVEEVFLPSRIERRQWSDRIRRVDAPLFPGYLFARVGMNPDMRVKLLKTRQVFDVVGRKPGRPDIAPSIPNDQIASLQRMIAAERDVDPVATLVPGTLVVVGAGALRGVRGVVEQGPDGQRRIVVNVSLLGRAVRTVLQADDVLEDPGEPR
jgi:transcription antitermination factor NusG